MLIEKREERKEKRGGEKSRREGSIGDERRREESEVKRGEERRGAELSELGLACIRPSSGESGAAKPLSSSCPFLPATA